MFRKIQVKHIRIVCGKDKLLVLFEIVSHNTKDTLLNICLNIREVLIAIVEAIGVRHNGCQEDSNIDTFRSSA